MKLKHQRQTPDQDLASAIERCALVLETNIANGVLAQGAVGLSAEMSARLLGAIDQATRALGRARADASWLLYRLHPQVQVQSTWEYVAGQTTMAALQAWDRGPAELQVHVDAFGVHVLVLSTTRSGPGIAALQAGGWVIVHLEDCSIRELSIRI
jgi:hypothetical protein